MIRFHRPQGFRKGTSKFLVFGAGFPSVLETGFASRSTNELVQKSEWYTVHRDAQTETKKQEGTNFRDRKSVPLCLIFEISRILLVY